MKILLCIAYFVLLALLAHPVGQALPRRLFHPDRPPFRPLRWEERGRLYEALGIKRWKDLLPDMSRVLSDMVPKKLTEATPEQIGLLLAETCRAEAVHWGEIAAGLAGAAICPNWFGWVLTGLWAVFGNLPFILIQRYNRPRLIRLGRSLAALERRKEHHHAHSDPEL